MDKLNHYIQNGKQITANKLFLTFMSISFVFGTIFYVLTSIVLNRQEIQATIREIPTITIKDGIVQSPQLWEKELPKLNLTLTIDNSSDTPKVQKDNSLYLGRTGYILMSRGITQKYIFQGVSTTITPELIIQYIKKGISQGTLFIVLFALLFLYLGFYGTFLLSKLIIRLLQKETSKDIVKRASFVGWMSITTLNLILIFFGAGLGWLISIPLACAIALFCILKGSEENNS